MSITPLNITGVGNAGTQTNVPTSTPNPIVSNVVAPSTEVSRAAETTQPSQENVTTAMQTLNDFAASRSASLNFTQDEDTGTTIVKIIDKDTDKVIRQIPSEEAIAISKSIDKMTGIFIDKKA